MLRHSTALWLLASTMAGFAVDISTPSGLCSINPATLELTLTRSNQSFALSAAQTNLGPVADLKVSSSNATWSLPEKHVAVAVASTPDGLLVYIQSETTGEFTFPILAATDSAKGWILPMFEGSYAPCDDPVWFGFLTNHTELNTTADFCLPFLALDYGTATLTCIATNPFNNSVSFVPASTNRLNATFTHTFTRNHNVKDYAVLFRIGGPSPIEPALQYRDWAQKHGGFVSLQEKLRHTPEAEKLLGAPQAYLWGDDLISYADILDWKRFAQTLLAQSTNTSGARAVWDALKKPAREAVTNLTVQEFADRYTKSVILEDLNQYLNRTNSPGVEAIRCRRNCEELAATFPGLMAPIDSWGSGVSPKMVEQLVKAGFTRFWLGAGGWESFVKRPETVAAAKKAGYLIGTYDSYNSIHHPKATDTWQTAQFDLELYNTGAVVNADGSKKRGFKQKGYVLNTTAARPYVEKRVTELMSIFHANSWFMDCDGFGDFFDDYSPAHPATQQSDMQARIARMEWIRDQYGAVIGTEGCSAGISPAVHFAHGVLTPVIGWGDPDLTGKKSPYYLGNYYPPDEPAIFFKPVPTKEIYRHIYFDPRFRLPLFQAAFHDSVIATHHWSFPSLKTKDNARNVELLELLYNIPPLYHLNLAEFEKRKAAIRAHYDFFSPIHRELALLPLTGFKWLTPDLLIQQTTFGDTAELVANFSSTEYHHFNTTIPPASIYIRWLKTGRTQIY